MIPALSTATVRNFFVHSLAALLAAASPVAYSDKNRASQTIEEIVVTASRFADALAAGRAGTSDTARLLENIPGVSTYGAGGISSLPAVHGLADDRLRTLVDGMDLMTACPNHMNPALSFIDPTSVASVEVFAGITPVSLGGDSIGGTIEVKSAPPEFAGAKDGILVNGQLGSFFHSNGNAHGYNLSATLAGQQASLSYKESDSESDNYRAAGDFRKPGLWQESGERHLSRREVGASAYDGSRNRDLGLALRLSGKHLLELNASEQRLAFEGFPNQRMDMILSAPDPGDPSWYVTDKDGPANRNRLVNLRYTGHYPWGGLEARVFRQEVDHHMDMNQDRFYGMYMPMDTEATTLGGLLTGNIELSSTDTLRIGGDFQRYRLDDWWPPVGPGGSSMCCDDFRNIRNGKRDRAGIFAEWEARRSPAWLSLLGVRGGIVESDAGSAQGYNVSYSSAATAFNARDHQRQDHHLDLTALVRYLPGTTQTYEAGIARKTRSPSLYERYPWSPNPMVALMNNFVGDGNAYIGNLDLQPEVAHTLSISGDWHDADQENWNLQVTGYLTYVRDFIDAQRCSPSMYIQCSASNVTTTDSYVMLRYVNQSARLYGLDISGRRLLGRSDTAGNFTATGILSYGRGENRTTGDNLYHIMPLNMTLTLAHRLGSWTNTAEVETVEAKEHVSRARNEAQTPDYTLLNLRTSYEWKYARLDVSLENALDEFYLLPLGGAYLGQGNSMSINDIPWGMVVPGRGRSLNVALNVRF